MWRFMVTLGVLLLSLTLAPLVRAQQGGAPSPATQQGAGVLRCQRLQCSCAEAPFASDDGLVFQSHEAEGCSQVICRCLPSEEVAPEAPVDALPTPETPRELFTERSVPVSGFLMNRRSVGLRLELGYPYLDIHFMYGVHDVFEIGVGYRGMYNMSFAGYGSLKFRLYHSGQRASLSLIALGGYHHVQNGEGHDKITSLAGGDGPFMEFGLAASVGRYGHYFTVASGVRLAWVREQAPCESEDDYYYWDCDMVFPDGEAGFMPVAFLEVGYAARVWRLLSLFISTGFDAFTNSQAFLASARFRLGLMFDF